MVLSDDIPASVLRTLLAPVSLLLASACNLGQNPSGDHRRISGVYQLQHVDGAPLPVEVSLGQGCTGSVLRGELELRPAGVQTRPSYSWSVAIQPNCSPTPPGVPQGNTDVGSWDFDSDRLAFRSRDEQGHYAATLIEPSGAAPQIRIPFLGRTYAFTLVQHIDAPTGVVYVKAIDQGGAPVAGVLLSFAFPNGRVGGGQTPASGEFGTMGVVGVWTITVQPPEGYSVAPAQPNPFTTSVGASTVQHLQISLVRD